MTMTRKRKQKDDDENEDQFTKDQKIYDTAQTEKTCNLISKYRAIIPNCTLFFWWSRAWLIGGGFWQNCFYYEGDLPGFNLVQYWGLETGLNNTWGYLILCQHYPGWNSGYSRFDLRPSHTLCGKEFVLICVIHALLYQHPHCQVTT